MLILTWLCVHAVYGVLPISVLFLVAYSFATQRFSRATLFNITISIFLALYTAFALLYPHHESVHLHGFANHMLQRSPAGFAGLIGMVRNWMFTLFYCTSELWGDVVLSLLFWGLANETTSMRNAPVLYPLFGVGANVAQTLAGRLLSAFSSTAASHHITYAQQVQMCMMLVLGVGLAILALHHYINVRFPHTTPSPILLQQSPGKQLALSNSAVSSQFAASSGTASSSDFAAFEQGSVQGNGTEPSTSSSSSNSNSSSNGNSGSNMGGRSKLGFMEAVHFLAQSPQIRCLAMMALAQGLSTNLLDVAWKQHLHMLHPSPAAYSVRSPPLPLAFGTCIARLRAFAHKNSLVFAQLVLACLPLQAAVSNAMQCLAIAVCLCSALPAGDTHNMLSIPVSQSCYSLSRNLILGNCSHARIMLQYW